MQGILYEEASVWQFLFVTCLLGGGAAWMTGRACAQTWRPYYSLVLYLLALGIGVRFIHHALFWGTMFTFQYYVVDTIVLLILGTLGYNYTRTNQMVTQYYWLYERASPLRWQPKSNA
jgi:small-conductance mechanosensitive channel